MPLPLTELDRMTAALGRVPTASLRGSVVELVGATALVADFAAPVGAMVEIDRGAGEPLAGEVVGFRDHRAVVAPYGPVAGVRRGASVVMRRAGRSIATGPGLLGRVLNARGEVIDGRPRPATAGRSPLDQQAPSATRRPRIDTPLSTGVRAIDALLSCGRGQRLGIFAGSGVGKSVLLGTMARQSDADVIVIGLVGERGREVNEFIERDLGPEGLARSVLVVATSDEAALLRQQAASTATAVAESFRDQGKDVLLLIDSVTRVAMACREIGLAAGEPPTTRGYPPSVFGALPRLVERAGRTATGSITAYYSVLVEGDDPNEPIADTMRGLLDGHVWLSRKLASEGHYPAIDVLQSLSRLMTSVASREHQEAARTVRSLLSALRENEDLLAIGAYRRGANRTLDAAVDLREDVKALLRQGLDERPTFADAGAALIALAKKAQARLATQTAAVPAQAVAPPPA